ncbi:Fe-S protein assembly co-chaperone HscB [Psychrobacter sp. I-STPA6b]|uniref:Fe-S protein assembly co-chaperone HscB n=1 Tax=Psychrobacter sp. I-STPA6b TaxID=2585718 RepID=UPI001D0C7355|nr:Fe-S protein assembly co-chaperone HscB [Psychrobacter sp. I-STPA6b]
MSHNTDTNAPMPQFDNFFALFEQPVQFQISQEQLEKRLRTLQQQYHPDNLQDKNSHQSVSESERLSALINHAYQTLYHPDTRASYLLEMVGQDADLNHSISDLDFLDDAMELRIEIDEANDPHQLQSLQTTVGQRIETFSQQFEQAYNQNSWSDAIDATQKLKFLVKLQKDIHHQIDELHQTEDADDDDDLYL